jgi:hypothetical protein
MPYLGWIHSGPVAAGPSTPPASPSSSSPAHAPTPPAVPQGLHITHTTHITQSLCLKACISQTANMSFKHCASTPAYHMSFKNCASRSAYHTHQACHSKTVIHQQQYCFLPGVCAYEEKSDARLWRNKGQAGRSMIMTS